QGCQRLREESSHYRSDAPEGGGDLWEYRLDHLEDGTERREGLCQLEDLADQRTNCVHQFREAWTSGRSEGRQHLSASFGEVGDRLASALPRLREDGTDYIGDLADSGGNLVDEARNARCDLGDHRSHLLDQGQHDSPDRLDYVVLGD